MSGLALDFFTLVDPVHSQGGLKHSSRGVVLCFSLSDSTMQLLSAHLATCDQSMVLCLAAPPVEGIIAIPATCTFFARDSKASGCMSGPEAACLCLFAANGNMQEWGNIGPSRALQRTDQLPASCMSLQTSTDHACDKYLCHLGPAMDYMGARIWLAISLAAAAGNFAMTALARHIWMLYVSRQQP